MTAAEGRVPIRIDQGRRVRVGVEVAVQRERVLEATRDRVETREGAQIGQVTPGVEVVGLAAGAGLENPPLVAPGQGAGTAKANPLRRARQPLNTSACAFEA
jgi:hypothetical protein